ncbi:hypothetical protein DNH61_16635 [Paenibacillus sambharensis]|uniref:beta-N-acetylhexosaminidase n=1 Tax=Paenibacillus sambharensis TaxID=1803190 RepID=A0A2W1L6K7_9BACL|nr:glycoside hydrolase family 3 N-terminal domain-containing protein [Paenibacillus sambharensis]PZD94593.1 hypothetical protein DNH61_16635 [Paenibacillus sambharensis]
MKRWQKAVITLGCTGLLCGLAWGTEARAEERFRDLQKAGWAKDGIQYLADRGTVAGYGGGRFGPLNPITRAQAAAYLVRELVPGETQGAAGKLNYLDVPESHPFYNEIAAASTHGFTGGLPDGTFRPDAPVSRAETAVMLLRAYGLKPGAAGSPAFTDISRHWAGESVHAMASLGLIGGYPDQTFRPDRPVNRAEFAVMLTRVIRSEREKAIAARDWDRLLSLMTLPEKAGQMLMPDIRMWEGKRTTAVNEGVVRLIEQQHAGGLILFDKNIDSAAQLTTLTDELQRVRGDIPLLLGIDQEGGVVKRIPGGTNLPGNMALGATGDPGLSREAGKLTGEELQALGVNVNFAPVLDINVNAGNPIIGIRSFGSEPELVSTHGIAFMNGLKQSGIIAAVKHFPGHGDTSVDSHLGLPVLDHDRDRLDAVELKPFKEAIAAGADMIMTAHVAFPAVEPSSVRSKKDGTMVPLPATLSRKVLTDLLRTELGYEGVIISDAFTMNAISGHFGEKEAVSMAVAAGVDIILMPSSSKAAHEAIMEAVRSGEIGLERIDESVSRIMRLKDTYGLFAEGPALELKQQRTSAVVGSLAHRKVEKRIAEAAVTKLADTAAKLPFNLKHGDRIAVIAGSREHAAMVKEQLELAGLKQRFAVETAAAGELEGREAEELIARSDYFILASYQFRSPIADNNWRDYQRLIDEANQQSKTYVLLSLGNPYELQYLKHVKSAVAVYGAQAPNVLAGIRGIFGLIPMEGKLPVE